MKITIQEITPELAQTWLNANCNNRDLRVGLVERYAEDMKNGKWTQCPEPISFYEDNSLADGQHRLFAIVEAGVPVQFPIVTGLKREDGLNINTGAGRTVVDAARISGVDEHLSNTLISVARAIAVGDASSSANRGSSNAEKLAWVDQYREAAQWAVEHGPVGRGLRNAPVMAALARAWYYEADKARLAQFAKVFGSGFVENADADSAAIALRNYYLQKPGIMTNALWRDTFLKTMNAIVYFMRGRKLTIIKGVKDEAYPLKKAKK